MCKLAADLKINGRWNESHKAVNIYINQVTHPVFIPGILSLFSRILCHLIHKHGLQFHEMHRALMHLQYKHSPPSVEQFEQVHRAMRLTEQQCPRRGGGRGLSGGSPLQLPPRILGMCIPCDSERHQPRENNHLVYCEQLFSCVDVWGSGINAVLILGVMGYDPVCWAQT